MAFYGRFRAIQPLAAVGREFAYRHDARKLPLSTMA